MNKSKNAKRKSNEVNQKEKSLFGRFLKRDKSMKRKETFKPDYIITEEEDLESTNGEKKTDVTGFRDS